jgi:uncharacterized protein YndB with AHSA1/START domain
MTAAQAETRIVTVERDIAHPPERIWRALTQPHLIREWLMRNDFVGEVGHRFTLTGDWGSFECRVLEIEPGRTLSYSWDAMGLESVVIWTLTPSAAGTLLRMEQAGFRPDQEQAYQGAKYGWRQLFGKLEQVLDQAG